MTHEDNDDLTGFQFGRRTTGTIMARLYDKTVDVARTGKDWWVDIWAERYDPTLPVLRVEFEIGRAGLVEFGIDHPSEGLDQAADLWASLTEWLSYRVPSNDQTKSRWRVSPEWEAIRKATLRGEAIGLDRVRAGKEQGISSQDHSPARRLPRSVRIDHRNRRSRLDARGSPLGCPGGRAATWYPVQPSDR